MVDDSYFYVENLKEGVLQRSDHKENCHSVLVNQGEYMYSLA
jgi:hypothetical protein